MIHINDLYRLLEVDDLFDAYGDEKPAAIHENGYSPIIQGCIDQVMDESIYQLLRHNCYCFFVGIDGVIHPLYVTASSYGKALVTMVLELDSRGVHADYGIRNELVMHVIDCLGNDNLVLSALMIDTILESGAKTEEDLERIEKERVPRIKRLGEVINWDVANLMDVTRDIFKAKYIAIARPPLSLKVMHKKMGTTPGDDPEEFLYWYFFFAAYDNRKILFPHTLYKDMLEYRVDTVFAKKNFTYEGISEYEGGDVIG